MACGTLSWTMAQPEMLDKVQKALALRRELLRDYSVEAQNRTLLDTPRGRQRFETREEHFRGGENQFRRDVLRLTRDGVTIDPSQAGRGGRGVGLGGAGLGQRLQGLDVLVLPGLLDKAEVVGASPAGKRQAVEIRFRPSLPRLQAGQGRLWVDPQSGMPLRVELPFRLGPFAEARLELDLDWDAGGEFTVPKRQTLKITGGGMGGRGFGRRGGGRQRGDIDAPGGGASLETEVVTTWKNYRWGLDFDDGFFEAQSADAGQRRRAQARDRAAAATGQAEEDPFEEIRIRPRGSSDENETAAESTRNEVLIQGGAVSGGADSSQDEAQVMQRVLGGRGGGGLRGARIAGSRANGLQGAVNAGLAGSALDAKPYSLDGTETPEPDYFSWNLGVSAGGPLGGASSTTASGGRGGRRGFRGRPSFFVNFNTNRGDELSSAFAAVPTAAERQGDFSQTVYTSGPLAGQPVCIYDPNSGAAFEGAAIPTSRLDNAALGLLDFIPLPNRDDPFLNFYRQESLTNTRDRLGLRVDLPVNDSLRLGTSYNFNRSAADGFNVFPGLESQRSGQGHNAGANFIQTIRRGFIHSTGLRWNRNRNQSLNPFARQRDIAAELGIENTSTAPLDYGLTTIDFTNYTTLNDGNSSFRVNEATTVSDSLLFVWKGHFFRVGGQVGWRRSNRISNPLGAGSLTFAGAATSLFEGGQPQAGSGYDLADFLLGLSQSSRIQYGNSDHYLRRREVALWVNENWRLHSRLTLQWGLRYEYTAPWVEKYDRIANLDVAPGFSEAQTVVPGDAGDFFGTIPRALIRDDKNNLAPRLGLAFRLRSGRRSSVLRAEYGVFYPDEAYDSLAGQLLSQPPFGFTIQQTAQGQDFLGIREAFSPELAEPVANTYAVDPFFRLPTVQNWGLSWQQSLPGHLFVSVGYAGSRGTGLELLRAPNRVVDGRPQIGNAAEFLYLASGASSTFHGLQILATRRMRSGLSVNLRYEYGKSLDNASAIAGGARTVAQNDADLNAERGRSRFDQRHKLRLNWFWGIPLGNRHRWLKDDTWLSALASNWFLTGSLQASSGRPFTARLLGNQINNSGSSSQASERAGTTGQPVELPSSQRTTLEWFNTNAFRLPEPGFFGEAGRNTIEGPGSWTVNLILTRSIPLNSEGRRLVLSFQADNVFNHVNYTGLNTTVNSRGFGQVTAAGPMRQLRMNFRFMF